MAAESIRGDGLFRAHDSLLALVNDPGQLANARQRFDDSPPPYRSQSSGNTTLLESPTPPSDIQRRRTRDERRFQLQSQYHRSHPDYQFRAEWDVERSRLLERIHKGLYRPPRGVEFDLIALKTVKARWIGQGIWNESWTLSGRVPGGRNNKWKHEEPLEPESEWETDPEQSPDTSFLAHLIAPRPRRLKSKEERQRIAERLVIRAREREGSPSRPFCRFIEQMSREREWLKDLSRADGTDTADSHDINTIAYTRVRDEWMERGLWYHKWGLFPGMAWKHEQPLEQYLLDELGPEPVVEAADPPAPRMPFPVNLFGPFSPSST